MAVKGTKKVEGEWSKKYGIGSFNIIGVNMSYQELKDAGFYVKEEDLEKEREFTGDDEGIPTIRLEFACESLEGLKRKFTFFVKNENNESKAGNFEFINDQAKNGWSTSEKKYIPKNAEYALYFTGEDDNLNPRPAKQGEYNVMSFLRCAMAIDWKNGGTLSYDWRKIFQGNVKEIREDLASEFKQNVVVACTIATKDTDNGPKQVESFYQYAFAPGGYYKTLLNHGTYSESDVQKLHASKEGNVGKKGKDRTFLNALEELIIKMTDKEYPCKDMFHLGKIKDFSPEDHGEMSDKAIISTDTTEPVNTSRY